METNKLISWNEQGDGFIIKSQESFTPIISEHFSANKFSSFVRQLNFYCFTKMKNKDNHIEYANPNFKRHEKPLIKHIKRKKRIKKVKSDQNKEKEESLLKEYNELFAACKKLEMKISSIYEYNNSTRQANDDLENKRKNFVDEIAQRIDKLIKGFSLLIYFANQRMLFRVYASMVLYGIATSISSGWGELTLDNIRTSIMLRVNKLLFYTSEDNNYLSVFYKAVVGQDTKMEHDPDFLEFFEKNKSNIQKYIFGEESRLSRMHSESVCSENNKDCKEVDKTINIEGEQPVSQKEIPVKNISFKEKFSEPKQSIFDPSGSFIPSIPLSVMLLAVPFHNYDLMNM